MEIVIDKEIACPLTNIMNLSFVEKILLEQLGLHKANR